MSEDIVTSTETTTSTPSTDQVAAPSAPEVSTEVQSASSTEGATAATESAPVAKGYKGLKGKHPAQAPAAEVAPAWNPDWKYKFNGQDKEVDEFFRPLAKDQAALEKVKDMIQRAEAVEMHKQKSKQYETEISQYKPTVDNVNKLRELYHAGEHERVLESIGYDDETLFKIVQEKLNRQQMPAEQQAMWQEKQRLALEKEQLLAQNEQYRSQAMQELAARTNYELDNELGKADYQAVKTAYEAANGSGSFKQLVVERGSYLVDKAGKHVPPSEVMAGLMKEFSPFVQHNQQTAGAVDVTQQAAPAKPRIIPNVGRGGGSPARTAITSLDQLKKLQQQFQ